MAYLRVYCSCALKGTNPVSFEPSGGWGVLEPLLVVSHAATNQCHWGNEGSECQIAVDSGSKEPFWSTARSWNNKVRLLVSGSRFEDFLFCFEISTSFSGFFWEKKLAGCCNSMTSLGVFLEELSWGSKQHGDSKDAVMTDGISEVWHNSPIWFSYPVRFEHQPKWHWYFAFWQQKQSLFALRI